MNNNNYVVIAGWMCNELKLSGNELLIFALIYGFSQDGESEFCGSRTYIANTFNISKPTVDKSLKSLMDKNLITKREIVINDIKLNRYKISLGVVKKLYRGGKETLLGGGKETLHNNTNINNSNNNNRFTPPTLEEVQKYCKERQNNVDPQRFVDFYESKGWMVGKNKMKSWKACVRTWERGKDNKTVKSESHDDLLNMIDPLARIRR